VPSALGPRSGAHRRSSSSFDPALKTALHLGNSFVKLVEVYGRSFAATGASRIEGEELLLLQALDVLNIGSREHARLVQFRFDVIARVVADQ